MTGDLALLGTQLTFVGVQARGTVCAIEAILASINTTSTGGVPGSTDAVRVDTWVGLIGKARVVRTSRVRSVDV
jgi:hypothetical protein